MSDFNHFKHEWFDPYGPFAPLYLINNLRLSFIQSLQLKNIKKVIDIGCGAGIATNKLPELFPSANVTGLDASYNAITLAREYADIYSINTQFIQQSALDRIDEKHDLVLCFELIEHIDNPAALLENCADTTTDNGTLILSTLDRSLISFIQNILIAEDLLGLIEPGTHDFSNFLKPSELIQIAEKFDLKVTHMSGIKIDPMSFEATLSSENFANYIVAFEKH